MGNCVGTDDGNGVGLSEGWCGGGAKEAQAQKGKRGFLVPHFSFDRSDVTLFDGEGEGFTRIIDCLYSSESWWW
jgi:hypothetical protein